MQDPGRFGGSRSWRWLSLFTERGLLNSELAGQPGNLRVKRMEIDPGQISATVLDGESECSVVVRMPEWQDDDWASVIDSLSRQALYAAQMLAGELPDELEGTLQAEGLSLLPTHGEVVSATCSCCRPADARCPHLTAVLRSSGELLADDPWLLFLLRGRVRQQVLRSLRRKRRQNGDGNGADNGGRTPQIRPTQAYGDDRGGHSNTDPIARPLQDEIHNFWGSSRVQEQFRPHIVRPSAELVLLRRLGPPAFSHANAEVFDALTAIYRKVGEAALALAYAEDPLPEDTELELNEEE